MATSPSSSVAMEVKAPTERSNELSPSQVGQRSATVTVTLAPDDTRVMSMVLPQYDEACESLDCHQALGLSFGKRVRQCGDRRGDKEESMGAHRSNERRVRVYIAASTRVPALKFASIVRNVRKRMEASKTYLQEVSRITTAG